MFLGASIFSKYTDFDMASCRALPDASKAGFRVFELYWDLMACFAALFFSFCRCFFATLAQLFLLARCQRFDEHVAAAAVAFPL